MGNQQSGIQILICDDTTAKKELQKSEDIDRYRALCLGDRANAGAREFFSYVPIHSSKNEFLQIENRLQHFCELVHPVLQSGLGIVKVIILMPTADGGMPHTRAGAVICLPMTLSLMKLNTFEHELWHCHQKRYSRWWKKFYEEKWNMTPWKGEFPSELANQIRINPDTCESGPMIWRQRWVAVPVFLSPTSPQLKDCAVWWWDNREKLIRKSSPPEWDQFFACNQVPAIAHEHPNELSAYYLGNLDTIGVQSTALVSLLKWLDNWQNEYKFMYDE